MKIKKCVKKNAGMKQDLVTHRSGCRKIKMPLTDKEKESKKMIEDFILTYSKKGVYLEKKFKLSVDDYRRAKFDISMINIFSILDKLDKMRGGSIGKCTRRNVKTNRR